MHGTGNEQSEFSYAEPAFDYTDHVLSLAATDSGSLPIYDIDVGAVGHVKFSEEQDKYPALGIAELALLSALRERIRKTNDRGE